MEPRGGEDDGDGDAVDPKTLMATLIDAGALVDDGETLRLDESFRTAMYDRIAALRRGSDETLAERAAAVAGPDTDGQVHDGRILLAGQRDAWLSRPIALAETAAAETLRERGVDDGVARGRRDRRAFLDTCPPVTVRSATRPCGTAVVGRAASAGILSVPFAPAPTATLSCRRRPILRSFRCRWVCFLVAGEPEAPPTDVRSPRSFTGPGAVARRCGSPVVGG